MKKLFALATVACLALAGTSAQAHTEDNPVVVPLLAGQTTPVGEVRVWNDGDYLYVKLVPAPGEAFLETHVHVATDIGEGAIPVTKKGNPIPGQFECSSGLVDDPDGVTYPFDLEQRGWEPCDDLIIAAHAAMGVPATLSACSSLGATEAAGPLDEYAVLGSGSWPAYAPAVACWVHGSWPSIAEATWVSTAEYTEDPVNDSWRKFRHVIDIPGWPIDAAITATSDNAEEVYLNGTDIGSDGEVEGPFIDNHEWNTVLSYTDDGTNLLPGLNNLEFIVRNYAQSGGTATSNPTGLIYCVEINYYEGGETAWAEGTEFATDRGWATYFTYEVQCPEPGLVNGDFESPVVSASQGWDIYPSGTSGLGWTVEWLGDTTTYDTQTRPSPAQLELHRGVNSWSSYDGSQHAELDTDWGGPTHGGSGEPASVAIYQDLSTCECGTYTLRYAWSPRPGHDNNVLEVYWDGELLATHSGSAVPNTNTSWTAEIHTGLSVTGYITRLEFREVGNDDSLGMFLDAVSVTLE